MQVNSGPGSEAERLKSAGNDAFKAKDWDTAIQLYRWAIRLPGSCTSFQHILDHNKATDRLGQIACCAPWLCSPWPYLSSATSCVVLMRFCSAALDVPVPHEALIDEGPRRANYHANRAAAYLERYKEMQPAGDSSGASSGLSSSSSGSSGIEACRREVGGVLEGLVLDKSSPEACAQLLQAAVMDCKAALDLMPTHAKAHYR